MSARCPACGNPTVAEHKPFCSRGCRDRDLLKWLNEGYRIPGPAADLDMIETDGETGVDKADGGD